ncbi:Metallo-dependent phosphatase-like protein [Boletus coccyginus]|nr:Metallo-dependent phosphatase-like protein [Boletus coccyginus]
MLFSLLSLVGLAREYPQFPLTPPYRPLVWGDFNVIHTTDTHGWLLGHQKSVWPEPNYSGDLGDFANFVTHMKQIAIEKDVDLLLVDSGDLHDGTGLSDGFPPGSVDAHESNKFLELLPYDVMAIGNHELYVYANTYDMYTNFAPNLNGRYLSSNVNITVLNSDGEVVNVPVGDRYTKFTTSQGRSVTSLGVLFDFTGNSANTTVQSVADMVKEEWVSASICIRVANDNWPVVFDAIRAVHPYTPILIFGGHSHIRDCQQYDGRSMALESGRYMETIGFIGADLGAAKGNTNNVAFTRRYLDQNRVTYEYHTMTSNSTFDTTLWTYYHRRLAATCLSLDPLSKGCTAYIDHVSHRNPYPSSENVVTLFIAEALPVALAINNTRAGIPNIIIIDSGGLRYDVFEGPFTKNDQLTAAPFADVFYYIPSVMASVANQRSVMEKELWSRGHVESRYRAWLQGMESRQVARATNTTNLTLGVVLALATTRLHTPLPYYSVPDYVGSNPPNVTGDTPIDLVFMNFIESSVLKILNSVQNTTNYTSADVSVYTPTLANAVLGLYAQAMWN